MKDVVIISDASLCDESKVGGIGWKILVNGIVVDHGGRSIFHDCEHIGKLELKALKEAVQASRRFRRCGIWEKVRTAVITDNVEAYIELPVTNRMHKREIFTKYLLKAIPRRYSYVTSHHKDCDEIAHGMMLLAREQIK